MQLENTLSIAVLVAYALAALVCVTGFIRPARATKMAATGLALVGLATHLALLGVRWSQGGHLPLVSMYEYLNAFAAMVVLCYLVFERFQRGWESGTQALGALAMLLALAMVWHGFKMPAHMKQGEPLMPVLRSYWLVIHVSMAVVGYGAAALASALAVLFFARTWWGSPGSWLHARLPAPEVIDQTVYRAVRFAFPFLTMLNITGAVWAYYAWGRYWGWDPKETWSLITWLTYVFYLHARLRAEWRPAKLNALILIGLGAILFTFLGVNKLAAAAESLHAYAAE